jgi:tetratricopeptide (TPR) repeat protein
MKRRLFSLTFAALLALSCQSANEAYAAPKSQDLSALYADYLAGSYAQKIEDKAAQQKYFTRAFLSQPDDKRIGRRAVISSIETGDMAAAIKLSERVLKADKTEPLARAILGISAFQKGRNSRALKYFSGRSSDATMTILMQLTRGWVEADNKDYKAARETFSNLEAGAYFDHYAELQLAKIDALQGETDSALERLDAVDEVGVSNEESILTRAFVLVEAARVEEAIALLEEAVAESEAHAIGAVGHYLKRLNAGQGLPKFDARMQASRALTDPAFAFFLRNRSRDGAELYLRIAHWIDPANTKAGRWLGTILEEQGDVGERQAYEIYKAIGSDDAYYVRAQLGIAQFYFNQEQDDQAIKTLEDLNAREQSVLTRESLGRARFFRENYTDALPFYEDLVDSLSDEELTENIEPLRFRGIIYERLKRWPEAEADFLRVLDLVPDDVDTLNYLGYTWVDRGENLTEAFEMIRKAVEEEPQSGAIVDSLGWAHYKLGEYVKARENLEKAVSLSPSSATIIDHLGDVYWKLGRKREAGFQWKRALEFDPTDEERAAIEIKLDKGLDAVPLTQALP